MTTDRRGALRALGVVAAGVTAATLLDGGTAEAADSGNLVIGADNDATSPTTLGSGAGPDQVLNVNDGTAFDASADDYSGALTARSSSRTAISAYTESGSTALAAVVHDGDGAAVHAAAFSGIDLHAGGSGRIVATLQGEAGTPAGAGADGEQVRDASGDMHLWTGTVWERVAAVRSPYSGGAQHLLDSPIRLLDTRAGKASHNGPTGTFKAATTHQLTVSGFSYLGQTIPADAVAVFGNLTVVGKAHGYAIVFPKGTATPNTSNINYERGQTLANSCTCKVGANNAVSIYVSGDTEVLFDVVGFIA